MTGFIGNDVDGPQHRIFGEVVNFDTEIYTQSYVEKHNEPVLGSFNTDGLGANLAKLNISYMGEVPISFITSNSELSRTNWMTRKKIKTSIGFTDRHELSVADFFKPLVLDSDFKIIDGELRFELIKELQAEGHYTSATAPAVVYDVDATEASYLRIALNRMGEFARWDFKADPKDTKRTVEDLPEFLDASPQLQKLLEPFGFWADKLLPDAFFEDTVLNPPKKIESPIYSREIGLVKWAEIQTEINEQRLAEDAKSPLKNPGEYEAIFSLPVTEDDYVKTYAIDEEVEEYTLHMRDVAGIITDAYDVKRRAEKEAKGQDWQTKRRAPKQVIVDKKAEANIALDDSFNDSLGEEIIPLDDEELIEELELDTENSEDSK